MTDPRHSRLKAEMFVEMLHDEEDQIILSPDSESEISDADDLDQGWGTSWWAVVPAEFSSNPIQTHLKQLIKVFTMQLGTGASQ